MMAGFCVAFIPVSGPSLAHGWFLDGWSAASMPSDSIGPRRPDLSLVFLELSGFWEGEWTDLVHAHPPCLSTSSFHRHFRALLHYGQGVFTSGKPSSSSFRESTACTLTWCSSLSYRYGWPGT